MRTRFPALAGVTLVVICITPWGAADAHTRHTRHAHHCPHRTKRTAARHNRCAHIGRAADTQPPTAPGNLIATAGTQQVALLWSASTDNVGVRGYRIYRDGVRIATVGSSTLSYLNTGLINGSTYSYYVLAYDKAGNLSVPSNVVSATPMASDATGNVLTSPETTTSSTTSPASTETSSSSSTNTSSTSSTTGSSPPSYDSTVLTDHPVAFWDMSQPVGSETDLTGNGHNGAYKGGTPALTSMLDGEQAVDFNGSSEYMTVPSSAAFSIATTGQLTWEAWIRPDALQWSSAEDPYNYGYVDWIGKCQSYSPSCEWESRMYSSVNSENRCNRLSAYVFNPTAGLGSGADWQPQCNLLQAGQWLHVVGEYQTQSTPSSCDPSYPGTINIWVNGVEWDASYHYPTGCMSQYAVKPQAGSSPLDIGTMAMDTWFPGAVGKVAIYDYLLSQSQISAHFTAMTGASPSGSCLSTCTTLVPTP